MFYNYFAGWGYNLMTDKPCRKPFSSWIITRIGLLVLVVMLYACSWLKSPEKPGVNLPSQFNSAPSNYAPIESLPYLAWWQQFNDQNLNRLIESGLKSNLDLNIALSNLEQAQGQLKQVQLSWIPFVNVYAGYTSNPALGNIGTFYGIWPQYTINILKLIKQQEQAKYNVEINKAMVDGVKLTLIGQISASYFTLIASQEQLKILRGLDNDLQTLIKISREEIEIGVKDNISLAQILIDEKMVQTQINVTLHNITLAQNSLRYLINENPGKVAASDNFANLDFVRFKPGSLPATVLQNRPDLIMAEYAVKASYSGVGIAYGNLFPTLQLDTFNGGSSGNGTVGNPANYTSLNDAYLNWGINPSVFGQIEAQKGAYQGNVYKYIQTVRKILKDVDNDFSANRYYSQNYIETSKAYADLAAKYKLQQGLYQSGIMAYSDLLMAKTGLDNLSLSVNQAKLQQAMVLVSLYQNLAGGYKYQPIGAKP